MQPRALLTLLSVASGLVLTLSAAPTPADSDRYQRLQSAPITLYPESVLTESPVPAFFNLRARPDDAIVVSSVDALKGSARIAQLGVQKGEVWIYVPRELDLTQGTRRNTEGAKGIVYVPAGDRHTTLSEAATRRISESAATLGCRMVVGLEPDLARSLRNIDDIARHASILTIYDNQRLSRGAQAYRDYVERLVKEARAVNPSIKIELCISTGRDATTTKALAGVLWTCADLVDRIGIYCNDSAESQASLTQLYQVLRGTS
jgi:hypothetical protein